jgi:hypothetical protein
VAAAEDYCPGPKLIAEPKTCHVQISSGISPGSTISWGFDKIPGDSEALIF